MNEYIIMNNEIINVETMNDETMNNNFDNLSLTNNTINDNIMGVVDTMNSLSLETQDVKHYEETYYDYDREQTYFGDTEDYNDIDIETNENIEPNQYIEPNVEPNEDDADIEDLDIKLDEHDTSPYRCFGIPNIYCKDLLGDFDDEDFIFNRYDLPNYIKKYIKHNNSIADYVNNFCIGNGIVINYCDTYNSPELLYAKILYIYHYVYYYYKDLKHLKPTERLSHLPDNLLYFVENVLTILKTMVNEDELNSKELVAIENIYFKELIYGLHIIIKELSKLLQHYQFCKLWHLDNTHVKLFFKMVNNLCVIIIYMRLNVV